MAATRYGLAAHIPTLLIGRLLSMYGRDVSYITLEDGKPFYLRGPLTFCEITAEGIRIHVQKALELQEDMSLKKVGGFDIELTTFCAEQAVEIWSGEYILRVGSEGGYVILHQKGSNILHRNNADLPILDWEGLHKNPRGLTGGTITALPSRTHDNLWKAPVEIVPDRDTLALYQYPRLELEGQLLRWWREGNWTEDTSERLVLDQSRNPIRVRQIPGALLWVQGTNMGFLHRGRTFLDSLQTRVRKDWLRAHAED